MTGGTRRCIVVSTLAEASFYADHGFDDILYAYSLPFDKVDNNINVNQVENVGGFSSLCLKVVYLLFAGGALRSSVRET